jgi:zinc/manganese transport system substrate-binding protein
MKGPPLITRRLLLATAAVLVLATNVQAQDKLKVIATFSILGDIVSEVGGERVEVTTLVGPDGDAHMFQLSPAHAQAVAGAAVIVANGLGFEGWFDRLIEASGTTATVILATESVMPITLDAAEDGETGDDHAEDDGHDAEEDGHDAAEEDGHDQAEEADHDAAAEAGDDDHGHGAEDPHAWQNVANVLTYVGTIEQGLAAADPSGAEIYKANADAYRAELQALDAEIRAGVGALPVERRTVVTSHDSFGYFAAAYGLTFVAPQGMSTEAEASAQDVAALIQQIRETGISAVFVENIADRRLLDQIAAETGAVVGGVLFSDALSAADGPAPTYVAMMRHNLGQLTGALSE